MQYVSVFAHLCIYHSSCRPASSARAASSCRTGKVDIHAHKQNSVCACVFPCVITWRSIYQLTSVALTDWDWYAFGIHRIYGCFDAAFLLNQSRASNDEMAWESGPMVWGSPGVTVTDSTLCSPFHTSNQPLILFFSSERKKKKEKTIQDIYIYIYIFF